MLGTHWMCISPAGECPSKCPRVPEAISPRQNYGSNLDGAGIHALMLMLIITQELKFYYRDWTDIFLVMKWPF